MSASLSAAASRSAATSPLTVFCVEPRSQILGGILHIAPRLVCSTLNLIELAFGLQAFVARERANRFLDAASDFLQTAFNMLFAHRLHLARVRCPLNGRGCSLCL